MTPRCPQPHTVTGYQPTTTSNISFSFSLRKLYLRYVDVPAKYPYQSVSHEGQSFQILFHEFRAHGAPPSDIGLPGDVWIDITPNSYALYGRNDSSDSDDHWVKWPGSYTAAEKRVQHPHLPYHNLWCNSRSVTWKSLKSMYNKWGEQQRLYGQTSLPVRDPRVALGYILEGGSNSSSASTEPSLEGVKELKRNLKSLLNDSERGDEPGEQSSTVAETQNDSDTSPVQENKHPLRKSEETMDDLKRQVRQQRVEIQLLKEENQKLKRRYSMDNGREMALAVIGSDDVSEDLVDLTCTLIQSVGSKISAFSARSKVARVAVEGKLEEGQKEFRKFSKWNRDSSTPHTFSESNTPTVVPTSTVSSPPGLDYDQVPSTQSDRNWVSTSPSRASRSTAKDRIWSRYERQEDEEYSMEEYPRKKRRISELHRRNIRLPSYGPGSPYAEPTSSEDQQEGLLYLESSSNAEDNNGATKPDIEDWNWSMDESSPYGALLGENLLDIFYKTDEDDRLCCCLCGFRRKAKGPTCDIVTFPRNASSSILLRHSQTVHSDAFQDLLNASPEELAEIREQLAPMAPEDDTDEEEEGVGRETYSVSWSP